MPKALFFNVPGHGHVNPSLPLVAELTRRGHAITYVITEGFRASVEATGATFHAYKAIHDDYFDVRGLHGGVPQKVAHALMLTAKEILPELLDIAQTEQPDYILFDGMCPWGHLVAQIRKLPAVASLALSPITSPPPGAMLKMLSLLAPLIFRDFGEGVAANRQAKALADQYGLPAFGIMGIMNNTGDLTISYTSSYFQPYANTVSDSVRFIGWTLNEPAGNSSFSFEQVRDRRLIYVSLGTLNNDNAAFFRMCIDAFAGSDYYVMMTTGKRIDPTSFGRLPENIMIYGWVPQIEILKRAAVFISHSGLNSIHDSLYLGVPLLLVPQQIEQTLNSMRVVELGAGLMLKKSQVNPQSIRNLAARLLTEPKFKVEAEHVGDTLRAAGGVAQAADEVEALLRRS